MVQWKEGVEEESEKNGGDRTGEGGHRYVLGISGSGESDTGVRALLNSHIIENEDARHTHTYATNERRQTSDDGGTEGDSEGVHERNDATEQFRGRRD